nr:O-antigen ligase family protein [uncultured Pseudodesulfovibrio sp.]
MKVDNSVPFGVVALMCAHAAFLTPYIVLVHGERTNLFTSLLTLATFFVVVFISRRTFSDFGGWLWSSWEPCAWLTLGGLVVLSGFLSPERTASLYRSFAFFAPAFAGYWCGRVLLGDAFWQRYGATLFTALFAVLALGQIVYGAGLAFIAVHHHAMANMLIVLAVGPLTFFIRAKTKGKRIIWLGMLSLGFWAAYLVGSRFTILLPFVLLPLFACFGCIRKRYTCVATVIFLGVAVFFFFQNPSKMLHLKNYESIFYRVEGVPTAAHIAKQHPFFGIGLRASRAPYLEDYEMHSDLTDRDTYMRVVRNNVTSDNMLSTMVVGLGLLPTLLYVAMLAVYGRRVVSSFEPAQCGGLDNRMIGLALFSCLIHFTIQDGLLYPQLSWYFHLLLGVASAKEGLHADI